MSEDTLSDTSHIRHISIKPPPFYKSNPQTWFLQMESQFALGNITSSTTKFHHVLAALPEDIASNVPTTSCDYDVLKGEILNSLKANKHILIQQALNTVEMGNKRPTQFVNEIKRRFSEIGLAPDDTIIKARLSAALPTQIRTALVGHDDSSLDNYVRIADSMLAVAQPVTNPFHMGEIQNTLPTDESISSPPHPNCYPSYQRYPSYSHHVVGQIKQSPHSRHFTSTVRPYYEGQRPRVCNSHIFYAERARHCRPWCRWPNKPAHIMRDNEKTPHQSRPASPSN